MRKIPSVVSQVLDSGSDAMSNLFDITILFPNEDLFQKIKKQTVSGPQYTIARHDHLVIRIEGFEPPTPSLDTEDIKYRNVTLTKPKPSFNFKRELSITFRLDSYYVWYEKFKLWLSFFLVPATGFVTQDFPTEPDDPRFGMITVQAFPHPGVPGIKDLLKATRDTIGGDVKENDYIKENNFKLLTRGLGASEGLTLGASTLTSLIPESAGGLVSPGTLVYTYKQVWVKEVSEPKYKTSSADEMKITVKFGFGEFIDPQGRIF